MPRSNGSIGSTIVGCWSPSATSRLPKPKINIMLPRTTSIWQRDSQSNASGRPGAVQLVPSIAADPAREGIQIRNYIQPERDGQIGQPPGRDTAWKYGKI